MRKEIRKTDPVRYDVDEDEIEDWNELFLGHKGEGND